MKSRPTHLLLMTLLHCAAPPEAPRAELPTLPPKKGETTLPRGPDAPVRELIITLVGEVRGEIEPCGCPTLPYGGFERRERLLENLKEEGTVFHLDAGELLLKGVATTKREDKKNRSALLLELSDAVGVDAWAPGPSDLLALGEAEIVSLDNPTPVNATWHNELGETPISTSTIITRGDSTIGIIGLASEPVSGTSTFSSVDPVEAASEALATLPAGLDLVVGLGSLKRRDAIRVATEVPGIAALLTVRGATYEEAWRPEAIEGGSPVPALIVEAPDRGRYVQVMRLRLGSTADQPLLMEPDTQDWRDLLRAREQNQANEGTPSPLEATFAELGMGRNLVYITAAPLGSHLDGPSQTSATINEYKQGVLNQAAERAALPAGPHTPRFTSSSTCVTCHTAELARWALSPHARSWETLVRENESKNPECLPCHTTGFGQPGGLGELTNANIRKYKGVQCEACHGPLAGHPTDARSQAIPVTEASCTGCHDEANSPTFEYEKWRAAASCQGGRPDNEPKP